MYLLQHHLTSPPYIPVPPSCAPRWWVLEATPGHQLHAARRPTLQSTLQECGARVFTDADEVYRSAGPACLLMVLRCIDAVGSCQLAAGDKFTDPESYRVANYQTVYVENQCRHDYSKKIDRCSYEEYFNQTLRHVELTMNDFTKDQCKSACETEDRFVCRGFTWSLPQGRGRSQGQGVEGQGQGVCDLHSEDLVSTGSWLLRRTNAATYYRRVICLNISVECTDTSMSVRYRPRGSFTGRVYVPGRGEQCSARASGPVVRLELPLYGDCDVHFAHAVDQRPGFPANRTMAYVMLMIQNNPIIQTAGDRWVRVGCTPAAAAGAHSVDAVVAVTDTGKPSLSTDPYLPMAASSVLNNSLGASLSLYVVRTHDAPRVHGAALGEPLELRLDTTEESEIEAYHLVASSRLGDSSVLLLDSQGCPTGQVDFPPFTRTRSGGTQRLSARFKAFRFPTSHVVRFSLMVRYCGGKCAVPNCAKMNRAARETNDTNESNEETISYTDGENGVSASIREDSGWSAASPPLVVAQGGVANGCGEGGALELEMMVGGKDLLTADTLVHADHRSTMFDEERRYPDAALVCVHELLLVCVALAWLAIQLLLLIGCCVLVKR
ncbi:hypothetical protein JYU34_009029, partial [Plutella xylostella]